MATPDPRELKALIEQLNDVEKKISSINGTAVSIAFEGETDPTKIAEQFGSVEKAVDFVQRSIKRANAELNSFTGSLGTSQSLIKDINASLNKIDDPVKKARASFGKIDGLVQQMVYNTADLANLTEADIKKQKQRAIQYFNQIKLKKEQLKLSIEENMNALTAAKAALKAEPNNEKLQQQVNLKRDILGQSQELLAVALEETPVQKEIEDSYDKQLDTIKKMNSGLGISGGIIEGIGGTLEKLGFKGFSSEVDKAKEKMKELSVDLSEGGEKTVGFFGKLKVLGTGLKSLGGSLRRALTDPLVIVGGLITAIVKQFNHIDKVASNIGKTMGLTRQASLDMASDLKIQAKASGDIFLNMDRMVNAQLRISSAMGTTVRLTQEQLANNARLIELAGFSEQQAQGMLTSSLLTNKSQRELYDTVVNTNDTIYSSNALLKEASEITGQMAMLNGNNVVQISRGVAAAKRMGINMSTARDMAMGTLDFESSIRAEMELAVLTGKSINLNKARELAFQGKFNQAAGEMLKQEAIREAFQSGNVIAQRKAAEAAGLSVDQLADAFRKQQEAGKLRARQNVVMKQMQAQAELSLGRQLTLQEKQALRREAELKDLRLNQTFGEKINNITSKLGDLLGTVVGPAVDYLGDGLDRAAVFFGSILGRSVETKGATEEMSLKLEQASAFGQSLQGKFLKLKETIINIKDKIVEAFSGDNAGFKILGALVGGTVAFKGLGMLKDKLGFGKLGTSGNPMHVTMSEGGGLIKGIKNIFGGKGGKGKGNMLTRMMGSFKIPKMAGLGNIAKGAGKLLGGAGRLAGKAFLPLAAAMSVFDGVKGFTADPDAALGDKLKNAGSSILNGLTFGLLGKSPSEIGAEAESQGVAAAQAIPTAQVQAATGQVTPAALPPMPTSNDTNELLKHLIQVVTAGGDVIMDGRKVGTTLQLASFKL